MRIKASGGRNGARARTGFVAARCAVLGLALLAAGCGKGSEVGKPSEAPGASGDAKELLAALGGPASPEVKALYAGEFEAGGSEPNWRLDLLSDWVSFQRPGLTQTGGTPAQREIRANGAQILAGPLIITLRHEPCVHEGASNFPYRATVQFEGVNYEGCARKGDSNEQLAAANWSSQLPVLMPAIRICLDRAAAKPARVTIAYALSDGKAAVRLLEADGGRSECVTASNGSKIVGYEVIGDRDVLQGERDPIFTPAPGEPPQSTCARSEPAKGPNDEVVGWFTRRTC